MWPSIFASAYVVGESTVAVNGSRSLDSLVSISFSSRIFISVPLGIVRTLRVAALCVVDFLLVWECAAGISKAKQKTDTIKRAMSFENFRMVFSFIMICLVIIQ